MFIRPSAVRFGLVRPVSFVCAETGEPRPSQGSYRVRVEKHMQTTEGLAPQDFAVFGVHREPDMPDGVYVITQHGPEDTDLADYRKGLSDVEVRELLRGRPGLELTPLPMPRRTDTVTAQDGPHYTDLKALLRRFIAKVTPDTPPIQVKVSRRTGISTLDALLDGD